MRQHASSASWQPWMSVEVETHDWKRTPFPSRKNYVRYPVQIAWFAFDSMWTLVEEDSYIIEPGGN